MPSDSTPKHHSSPWYMLLNECKQQLTDNMFISPLWAQPANPPHNTAPAWVQGTAPLGHQSTNDEVRKTRRNVLSRKQKEEPWWLLQLEKCQDMAKSLWDTAINGCRNHKQNQANKTKSTGKTTAFLQLSILKEKATKTNSCPAFEVVGLFMLFYIYFYGCVL